MPISLKILLSVGVANPAAHMGEMDFRALQPNSRANHGQANEANKQQEEDGSHTSRATLSGSSSDILETRDGREEEGVGILPCTVGVPDEPSMNRFPFAIKSST